MVIRGPSRSWRGYIPVYSDVVDNGNEDSTSDPQDIARYAQELEQWFEHEAPSES